MATKEMETLSLNGTSYKVTDTNKVLKAGDTVNGNLLIQSSHITDAETPSEAKWGNRLTFTSSDNDVFLGAIQPYQSTAGRQGIILQGYRTVAGSRVSNILSLLVDSSGNQYVNLNQSAWQDALGITPTYSTTGTYTPTFSWSTSGAPTIESGGSYQWIRSGDVMMIHGRFNITALNAPSTAGLLYITLPSGISVVQSVAGVGQLMCSYSHTYDFVCRVATADGPIGVSTAGGAAISGSMQTGWHNFFAIVFVTN